ncbi:MAG TPA: DMT family transporter [Falsiroseomonas sp.]|nr:DMT family transporter [Falsiroseomonas sp.]
MPPPATGALPAGAAALLVVLCASWGLAQIAVKLGLEGISPMVQAGLRSCLAVPLLLAWCRWRGVTVLRRDGTLGAGLLAGVLFTGEFWALYEGLGLTTAARSTVLLYTAPFWATLGAHWLVPGDRLTARKLAGLLLAFAGLLVAFADRLGAPMDATMRGDLLSLLAGICWGATIVVIKASGLTRIAAERTLLYQLAAAAALLPLGLAMGEPGIFAPTPLVWGALAFQAVGIAFLSYVAWFWLVARHRASAFAPFLFLTPVFAAIAGAVVLGESVGLPLLVALMLIGGGIWVVNRG